MHLNQARLDQVQAGEEAGDLLAGAQRLRGGDALVVDALRALAWVWWMSIAGL
jgi:hypothetical protein